uniref:Lysozyme n=1 Tax=Oreochromis niloticus TaxID=8128 RepID=A0A669CQK4_ORENI
MSTSNNWLKKLPKKPLLALQHLDQFLYSFVDEPDVQCAIFDCLQYEEDTEPKNLYGLFQLSDRKFCDSGYCPSENVCHTSCTAFTDNDITDDIAWGSGYFLCMKLNQSEDSFSYLSATLKATHVCQFSSLGRTGDHYVIRLMRGLGLNLP